MMNEIDVGHVGCRMPGVGGLLAKVAVASLMFSTCLAVLGEPVRGSMRQGARKVSVQKAKKQPVAKRSTAAAALKNKPAAQKQVPQPTQSQYRRIPYVGALAADAETGRVIFSDNADRRAYPASVTKLMTALLVLEDIEQGRYKFTDRATASVLATLEQPSGVGFRPNQSMTIDDLLMSIMVRSANDAAVVLAEHAAGGDLMAFIARMNARAAELGMKDTKYDSPNGLPPYDAKRRPKKWRHGYDYSTCSDILKLAREVVKHPQIFKYTSTKIATVTDGAGKPLRSVNHNHILVKDKQKILNEKGESEVDGLKTGYIDAGGSSIVLSGTRNGRRAIVIVLGAASYKYRDMHARSIMLHALKAVAEPVKPVAAVPAEPPPAPPAPPAAAKADEPPATRSVAAETPDTDVKPQKDPSGGGASTGWLLILAATGVGAAAYFAWRWIGKDDRKSWDFEDIPPDAQ